MFKQGLALGGAQFMGLEGLALQDGVAYFVASEAGDAQKGQVWSFTPEADGGTLKLLYESSDGAVLDQPDNITVSPKGAIMMCEDGDGEDIDGGDNWLRVLNQKGQVFDFARNLTKIDLARDRRRRLSGRRRCVRCQRVLRRLLQPRRKVVVRERAIPRPDLGHHRKLGERRHLSGRGFLHESVAVVLGAQIDHGPYGYDATRIHVRMAREIVVLDVLEMARLGDPRRLVDVTQIAEQGGIVGETIQDCT